MPRHGTYASLHGSTHSSGKLHVLDTSTMTWSKPNVAGRRPLPRYRHASAMHGSRMFMFGGLGGGTELYALDTGVVSEGAHREIGKRGRRRGGRQESGSSSGNELISWLEGLGLGKYTRVFVRQEVDFDTLVELSADDLREMGIVALGPRKKLMAAISSLRGVGQVSLSLPPSSRTLTLTLISTPLAEPSSLTPALTLTHLLPAHLHASPRISTHLHASPRISSLRDVGQYTTLSPEP